MNMQQEEILYEMKVEILKAFANVTRLRIAEKLLTQELCMNEIVEALGLERTSVSKHVSVLHKANLLSSRKEGTTIYYSLQVPCIINVFGCIEEILREQAKAKMAILKKIAKG
jgi:DNA-binding transcriptional ArsR family regulator